MRTIVEPKAYINKLWGKQRIKDRETYRMMRYVLRVEHDGKVFLHNVITGQLVVLSLDEAKVLEKLPMPYIPAMESLVSEHYLVPEEYDEHQQVISIRSALIKLEDMRQNAITGYIILPTTACNARCYYCCQRDIKQAEMTEQTASDVVEFITQNSKGQSVRIRWLGGEPTLGKDRISQICIGLRKKGIAFSSEILTNGYLFDQELIQIAKRDWCLTDVVITIDGLEEYSNRIKAFVNVKDNPFKRILSNIDFFLENDINVGVKMNLDQKNYKDFPHLVSFLHERYHGNPRLRIRSNPVCETLSDTLGCDENYVLLKKKSFMYNMSVGNGKKHELPFLKYERCSAARDTRITILPQGTIVRCSEVMTDDQVVGDIWQGVVNTELVDSWKKFADHEKCKYCICFPTCLYLANCSGGKNCYLAEEILSGYKSDVLHHICN